MNKIVEYINETEHAAIVNSIKSSGKDIVSVIDQMKESRTEYGMKVQKLIEDLSQYVSKFKVDQILEAKEDCMNNFRKGERLPITQITDLGEIVLGNVVALEPEEVRKYFKGVG